MNNIEKKDLKNNTETAQRKFYETPSCDIRETKNEYTIIFDLPGIDKDSINLKVEKDVLTLTGECTSQADEGYRCVREEMDYNGFKRSFELNNTVQEDKITADFKDGTLTLTLPKREEQKTKEIQIKVS